MSVMKLYGQAWLLLLEVTALLVPTHYPVALTSPMQAHSTASGSQSLPSEVQGS